MQNLAGVEPSKSDEIIASELRIAGIRIIRDMKPYNGEVSTSVTGVLGDAEFRRAWYYWVVKCRVPLDMAQKMYANPIGKKDIRVSGHCGCPEPEDPWIEYYDDNGYILADEAELEKYSEDSNLVKSCRANLSLRWVSDKKEGTPYVTSYHIDSQEGLCIFAKHLTGTA